MLHIKLQVSETEKWKGHPQQYIISEADCFSYVKNRCETKIAICRFQSSNFLLSVLISAVLFREKCSTAFEFPLTQPDTHKGEILRLE